MKVHLVTKIAAAMACAALTGFSAYGQESIKYPTIAIGTSLAPITSFCYDAERDLLISNLTKKVCVAEDPFANYPFGDVSPQRGDGCLEWDTRRLATRRVVEGIRCESDFADFRGGEMGGCEIEDYTRTISLTYPGWKEIRMDGEGGPYIAPHPTASYTIPDCN